MKRGPPPSRAADGDVAVEARDDRRVDRGRHGDLRQRQQRRHRVRVDVGAVGVAQRPAGRKEGEQVRRVGSKQMPSPCISSRPTCPSRNLHPQPNLRL